MKITGERVVSPAGGFNPTWQRHVAAYALAEPELGAGRVLDLGCGVGHSFHLLAPRETVGVDVDARRSPARTARRSWRTCARCRSRTAASLRCCRVQSLEHVPDPERVLAEVARVLEPDGVAVFVTPNRLTLGRPDEIIDPYHHVEFDAGELRALCERFFAASRCAACSAPSATWSCSTRSAASSTGCCGSTRCGCAARSRSRCAGGSTT